MCIFIISTYYFVIIIIIIVVVVVVDRVKLFAEKVLVQFPHLTNVLRLKGFKPLQ